MPSTEAQRETVPTVLRPGAEELPQPFVSLLRYLHGFQFDRRLWTVQQDSIGQYLSPSVTTIPATAYLERVRVANHQLGTLWVKQSRSNVTHAIDGAALGMFMQPMASTRCGLRVIWWPTMEGRTPQSRNYDPLMVATVEIPRAWQCPDCARIRP